jgi:hypothetical protein
LALNNNQSLALGLFTTDVELVLNNNHSSNDYLQRMMHWRKTTITHSLYDYLTADVELALNNNHSLTL